MKKTKKRGASRIPAVVPRIVFSTLFVGVVPACVASACGSGSVLTSSDAAPDHAAFGVADVAFTVAAQCFDGSTIPGCNQLGVAAVAFQCFDGSTQPGCPGTDAAFDDPDADDGSG